MRQPPIAQTAPPLRSARALADSIGPAAIAAGLGLVLGAALVVRLQLVVLLIAAVLAVLGVALAYSRPALAFVGLVLLTALIPSYASPSVGPLLFIPAAGASWIVAVAVGWRNLVERGRLLRPTAIDLGVALFVILMAISIAFSPRGTRDEFLHMMFLWAGPCLAGRLLLAEVRRPARTLAVAFGLVTALVAPFALAEYLGSGNVFHNLNFNSTEFNVWAGQADRFGQVRAEASFGHPIALSMFVATSALLSFAMGLNSTTARERGLWFGSAALAIAVQALTVSRTGWLMIVIGVAMLVVLYVRGENRRRLVTLAVSGAVALLLAAALAPSALQILPGFEKHESAVQSSGDYRQALLERALEPGVLGLWGNAHNEITPFVNFGTATDNAYIILADAWGLIPTAALLFIAGALLWVVARHRARDREGELAIPVAAFAGMIALLFVAFITQQQVMIWLLIGAAGAVAERLAYTEREERDGRGEGLDWRM